MSTDFDETIEIHTPTNLQVRQVYLASGSKFSVLQGRLVWTAERQIRLFMRVSRQGCVFF